MQAPWLIHAPSQLLFRYATHGSVWKALELNYLCQRHATKTHCSGAHARAPTRYRSRSDGPATHAHAGRRTPTVVRRAVGRHGRPRDGRGGTGARRRGLPCGGSRARGQWANVHEALHGESPPPSHTHTHRHHHHRRKRVSVGAGGWRVVLATGARVTHARCRGSGRFCQRLQVSRVSQCPRQKLRTACTPVHAASCTSKARRAPSSSLPAATRSQNHAPRVLGLPLLLAETVQTKI